MQTIDRDIDIYKLKIEQAIKTKDYKEFKEKMSILKTSEIIYFFKDKSELEIEYIISEIRKVYPVFKDSDILALFVKKEFNSSFSTDFSKTEFEYLLTFLENNLDIDISEYLELLKANFTYKYKDRIEKLLERKKQNLQNKFNPYLNLNGPDLLFKIIVSNFNLKLDYYYSFSKDSYFSNKYKENLILNYLEEKCGSLFVKELLNALSSNNFKLLYKLLSDINLDNDNISELKDISLSKVDLNTYDISDISLLNYSSENIYSFLSDDPVESKSFLTSLKFIDDIYKDELKKAKSFDAILKDKDKLEYVLLNLGQIYKSLGMNIDIEYIKNNISRDNINLDYIKEFYILKCLYNINLYSKLNKFNFKKIESKHDFINLLRSEVVKNEKNLALKYNSYKLKKNDILPILTLLGASSALTNLPSEEDINLQISDIETLRFKAKQSCAKELFNQTNDNNRLLKYKKYFSDLEKIEGLSDEEIELMIYGQMEYLFRQRLNFLLYYDDLSDCEYYEDLLDYMHNRLHKELYENIEELDNEYDEIKNELDNNPDMNYKDCVKEIINTYEKQIKDFNSFIENITTADKSPEYLEMVQGNIDKIKDCIQDIREKECDILKEYSQRTIKDLKKESTDENIKNLNIELDDFVVLDKKPINLNQLKPELINKVKMQAVK